MRHFFSFLLFGMLFCTININAKIRILTFHYNLPELIEIQHKTLKEFVKEEYELIVFNDAKDPDSEQAIHNTCKRLEIKCVRFKPEWHDTDPFNAQISEWDQSKLYSHIGNIYPQHPSVRHSHAIQYALDHFGYTHNDLVALLDGDCFPSRPIKFKEILGKNHIVGIKKNQGRYDYLWVVFILFNPKKIPSIEDLKFHLDIIDDQIHDTGSHTYHYLKNHPDVIHQKYYGESSVGFYHWTDEAMHNWGFNDNEIAFIRDLDSLKNFPWPITVEFHVNNQFIHLGNSSFGLPGHEEKFECVKRFVNAVVKKKKNNK